MKRAVLGILVAGSLLAALTGCRNADATTVEDIHRISEFKQTCHDAGGYVTRTTWTNDLLCIVDDRVTRR